MSLLLFFLGGMWQVETDSESAPEQKVCYSLARAQATMIPEFYILLRPVFFLKLPKMLQWYWLALADIPTGSLRILAYWLVRHLRNDLCWISTFLAHISRPKCKHFFRNSLYKLQRNSFQRHLAAVQGPPLRKHELVFQELAYVQEMFTKCQLKQNLNIPPSVQVPQCLSLHHPEGWPHPQ